MTCYITGTIYPVICCLQNSDDEVIFPLGAKVSTFIFMFTFFFQVPNFFHHEYQPLSSKCQPFSYIHN